MEDDEYMLDEEFLKFYNHRFIDPYRIYFDKETGNIISITNEIADNGYPSVEIEFEKIERFLSGKDNFIFYRVEFDEEDAIKFVNKKESPLAFKSNIVEYVRLVEDNNAMLQVTWNSTKWNFKINKDSLKNPRSKSVNSKINFFITKENNINFLIRSIEIKIKDLTTSDGIDIEFIKPEESTIDEIAMFTLPFFESYGMTINYGKD
jgi:hypothetical protein